jgi:ABC-type uncharacterized transport system permease subunit
MRSKFLDKKYRFLFALSFEKALKNFPLYLGLSFFVLSILIAFSYIWEAIGTPNVYFSKSSLLWYIALNEWVMMATPFAYLAMSQEFKSGSFACLLLRPIAYVDAKIIETLAQGVVSWLFIGATCFFWCTWWTGHFPFCPMELLALIILGFFGLILCSLMGILVGLFSFWFQELYSIFYLWQQLLFICGGLIVPPSTFPKLLYVVSFLIPSPFILGFRSEFIFAPSSFNFIIILLGELLWIFLLIKVLHFLFRKGMKTFNTSGG